MAANNNQVNILLAGHAMHLLSRMTQNNMLIIRVNIQLLSQESYSFGCLLLQLGLHIGQIYWYISPVSEGQRL